MSSAYALRNLEDWEFKVADKAQRMLEQFDRLCTMPLKDGEPVAGEDLTVDYRMWSNFFTLDVKFRRRIEPHTFRADLL